MSVKRRYIRRKRNYEKFFEQLFNTIFDDDDLGFYRSCCGPLEPLFDNTPEEDLSSFFVSKKHICKIVKSLNENSSEETCISLMEKMIKKMFDVLKSEKGCSIPHEPFVKYHEEQKSFEIGFNLDIWDFLLWCHKDQGGTFTFSGLFEFKPCPT